MENTYISEREREILDLALTTSRLGSDDLMAINHKMIRDLGRCMANFLGEVEESLWADTCFLLAVREKDVSAHIVGREKDVDPTKYCKAHLFMLGELRTLFGKKRELLKRVARNRAEEDLRKMDGAEKVRPGIMDELVRKHFARAKSVALDDAGFNAMVEKLEGLIEKPDEPDDMPDMTDIFDPEPPTLSNIWKAPGKGEKPSLVRLKD